MAGRIRSIKPEILEDEDACALSDAAWRLWVSVWTLADDHGNARAGDRYLAAQVWQDTARQGVIPELLQELQRARRVILYQNNGHTYLQIRNWQKHQRIDNAGKGKVPGPEESGSTTVRTLTDNLAEKSANRGEPLPLSEVFAKNSASRDPAAGRDGMGMEGSGAEPAADGASPTAAPAWPSAGPEPSRGLAAISAELRRWPLSAALSVPEVARMLEQRWRSNELAKGTKLEWVLAAIGDAASDGVGLNAEALTRKLRAYCDNAKPPRAPLPASPVTVVESAIDRLNREQQAKDRAEMASSGAQAPRSATFKTGTGSASSESSQGILAQTGGVRR